MNFGRKKGRGGRRRANQRFFFLWYRVEFLILITHSPARWQEIGADVTQFQPKGRFCLCLQECEKFIQALASKYIIFILVQFLAKDTQEVSALSKKSLGLGKICWEIEDVIQNYRFSSIHKIIISILLCYFLLWALSISHGKQWSISNNTRIYLEVRCILKNSLVEFYICVHF